jgi:hypothetical protein
MEEDGNLERDALRAGSRVHEEEVERARESLGQLRQVNATLRHEREAFENRLSEIETSLSWLLILRLRRLRLKLFRPGTWRGRCWTLASQFVKTARTAGGGVALRKARQRVVGKFGKYWPGRRASGKRFRTQVFGQHVAVDQFRELPWRFLGLDPDSTPKAAGYFKILLVSHSACRTGAPLCLLRLAEELRKLPDVECFVVLAQGGELADSFARLAPTLEVDRLVARGFNRHEVPRVIASAFHNLSSRGVSVCNTAAVSDFHLAFAAELVEVLSWIR